MLGHHYDDSENLPISPTYGQIENILADNQQVEEQLHEIAELRSSPNV